MAIYKCCLLADAEQTFFLSRLSSPPHAEPNHLSEATCGLQTVLKYYLSTV